MAEKTVFFVSQKWRFPEIDQVSERGNLCFVGYLQDQLRLLRQV